MEEKKKIEIVTGDGSNLNISSVHKHLNAGKPKPASEKPTNVVVPEEINDKKEEKDDEE